MELNLNDDLDYFNKQVFASARVPEDLLSNATTSLVSSQAMNDSFLKKLEKLSNLITENPVVKVIKINKATWEKISVGLELKSADFIPINGIRIEFSAILPDDFLVLCYSDGKYQIQKLDFQKRGFWSFIKRLFKCK